jgi:hypothetical protein
VLNGFPEVETTAGRRKQKIKSTQITRFW